VALLDYYVLAFHVKLPFQILLFGFFVALGFCNPTLLFQISHLHRLLGSAEIIRASLRIDLVNWREKPMFGSASKTRTLAGTLG